MAGNIRQLDAPQSLGLNPTEIGVDAMAGAARRVGAFYNQFGNATAELGNEKAAMFRTIGNAAGSDIKTVGDVVVNQMDHEQISHGTAQFAEVTNNLTQQYNAALKNADPNDPSFVAKFNEETLQPALDQFKQGFTTERAQAWAEAHAAELQNHFITKSAADLSTLAGEAVKSNIRNSATSWSNTAVTDPSSVPFLLAGVDHSITGLVNSSPTLSAIDAARAKNELSQTVKASIVKSGAVGAIMKAANPEATADAWIKKYPDFINGDEAKALAANARSQIRARNYDFEIDRRRAKEVAQDKSNDATNQYLIDVRSRDPRIAGDPTAVKILNDQNLTKQDKNNLLNYVDRQLKPETDSRLSQQTFVGLLREMRAPNADPDAVMQKAWEARLTDPGKPGSMSEHDFNQFRQEVVARKTPEGAALERDRGLFFKQYAGAIAGPSYDPVVGSPKLYNAEMDARRTEAMLRQKGLDPHLAYDPASEYFLGRPERLTKYQGSMQTDLHDQAAAPAAAKPSRPETPPALRGIASLSYSKSRNLFRDDTSGKVYRPDGTEVK